jgi:imidazolonepropionase
MKIARYAPIVLALALPLSLVAQTRTPEQAQAKAPETWADRVIKQDGYATPPPELASAILAPRHLNVTLSNLNREKTWFLDTIGDGPVEMRTFSKPFHELGGVFIDHKANRARSLTVRSDVGIQLISAADGSKKAIQVPAGTRVSNATWSPDGNSVAYFGHTDTATHIYMADVASGKSRQLTKTPVLATLVTSFEFTEDGKHIATVLVPANRAAMPAPPAAPEGPTVLLAEPDKNRLRTYRSLMSTPYDFELLKWHSTGQLALIDAATGAVKNVGAPAMIRSFDPSPDGAYLRVTRMLEPFSYIVPVGNFGQIEELVDASGRVMAKLSDRPINLGVQGGGDDDDDQPAGGRGAALVDCHTHLLFGGNRIEDFDRRSRGMTYAQIFEQGGGIHSTVKATRETNPHLLKMRAEQLLERRFGYGIGTTEIKSGYGLEKKTELEMLKAIAALRKSGWDVEATLLAAHARPLDRDAGEWVKEICEQMIPEVAEQKLARFVDVFVEKNAYTVEEARRIFDAAKKHGLHPRLHADQITAGAGAELAAEVGAASADHLEHASDAGLAALAKAKVVAVLLPGAMTYLGEQAKGLGKRLVDAGVEVAVATDANPGSSPTNNLPLMATLAVTQMGLTTDQALRAITLGAARALKRDDVGSFGIGARGDFLVLNAPDCRALLASFGEPIIKAFVKTA